MRRGTREGIIDSASKFTVCIWKFRLQIVGDFIQASLGFCKCKHFPVKPYLNKVAL